jgi:pimeloyl-ACP methyl ester carboxylesterase
MPANDMPPTADGSGGPGGSGTVNGGLAYLDRTGAGSGSQDRLAYVRRTGTGTGVVWLGGLKSDMTGSKATALEEWAVAAARPYVRFDYFGHGASTGAFADGTVGRWREDALAVLDGLTDGPQVLVGSSMGAWIAVLAALARPDRIAGCVFIAPAADFTERLMWQGLPPEAKTEIEERGVWYRPNPYDPDDPMPISRGLIEDGRRHLVLDAPVRLSCPVRILQGMADDDVPWRHAVVLAEALEGPDVTLTLVKGGDHRLSSSADIARLVGAVETLCSEVD